MYTTEKHKNDRNQKKKKQRIDDLKLWVVPYRFHSGGRDERCEPVSLDGCGYGIMVSIGN